MKNYKEHLRSISTIKKLNEKRSKVLRASAIFPCFTNKDLDTRILFLGYWMLKKNLPYIKFSYKLRDKMGKILKEKTQILTETKSYSISIKQLLLNTLKDNFFGSIELEFFSKNDLIFPFPACVISLDYKQGSSFVHTVGRVYNNSEDEKNNSKFKVPEAGFDILPNKNFYPFISFVNGKRKLLNQKLQVKIINFKNQSFTKLINLKNIKPYETKFISLMDSNQKQFLEGQKGTAIIKHNLSGFYPRFLSGNCNDTQNKFSITHSYYDTKQIKEFSINEDKKKFHDATLTVPIFKNKFLTEISLYPIYCSTKFDIGIEFFSPEGKKIYSKNKFIRFKRNDVNFINLNNQIKNTHLKKIKEKYCLAKINFSGKPFPSRLKFGLNIKAKNNPNALASNVCFNAQLVNKNNLSKKTRFCWTPLLNKKNSSFIIYNTSFLKKTFRPAKIMMNVWREQDKKSISKKLKLNDNGSYFFDLNKNKKIKNFLKNRSGWVTFKSDNPFIQGYYLESSKQGNVGADHFF